MEIHSNSFKYLILICLTFQFSCINGFIEEPFFSNTDHYSQLLTQCAKKGINVDSDLMENVQACMLPISAKVREAGAGKDPSQILPTFCKHIPEVKECYANVFTLIEVCYNELFDTQVLFSLGEIINNGQTAFCSQEKDERIKEVLNGQPSLIATFTCALKHYMVIMEDLFSCPSSRLIKQLLLDPSSIKEFSEEEICSEIDKFERCLVSTLDLCGDKKEVVVKFIQLVYDIIVSIAFKCPHIHRNFE